MIKALGGAGGMGIWQLCALRIAYYLSLPLLPILSAVLYAVAMILTRTKCRFEHPATLALALNAAFILVGIASIVVAGILAVQRPKPTLPSCERLRRPDYATKSSVSCALRHLRAVSP